MYFLPPLFRGPKGHPDWNSRLIELMVGMPEGSDSNWSHHHVEGKCHVVLGPSLDKSAEYMSVSDKYIKSVPAIHGRLLDLLDPPNELVEPLLYLSR